MKKRYKITKEAQITAAIFDQVPGLKADEEHELELSYREEQALVAAGWIEEVKEKKKGG